MLRNTFGPQLCAPRCPAPVPASQQVRPCEGPVVSQVVPTLHRRQCAASPPVSGPSQTLSLPVSCSPGLDLLGAPLPTHRLFYLLDLDHPFQDTSLPPGQARPSLQPCPPGPLPQLPTQVRTLCKQAAPLVAETRNVQTKDGRASFSHCSGQITSWQEIRQLSLLTKGLLLRTPLMFVFSTQIPKLLHSV